LAEGNTIAASSTTSSTSGATIVSSQTVGKINDPGGQIIATVSLSEIDIISVKANQKAIITLDAYEDKTFTGKVLAVNTSGSVNSGVTSYPVTIVLDSSAVEIYPNMAVSVQIITNIKTDVLLVPSTAIQTVNNQSVVQVMKDKEVASVNVEIGNSNDSQTEIISGISEGDQVVTSTISQSSENNNASNTSSPFSGMSRSGSSTGGNMPVMRFQGGF
jgi:multidrug efflux pump subunit AcrA (membrane-fusion protein)